MSDLLGLALGGVRAARTALETVGDNVANAMTPGYVRRAAQLGSILPGRANSPFERDPVAAGGVEVRGIARAVDLIRQDSLRRAEGDVAMLEAADRWLSLIQSSLTGPASVEAPLGDFFASLADLASDPTSAAARSTVLARAESLAGRFNAAAAELARLEVDLALEARVEADRLTSLADALADVNAQLRRATPGGGAAAGLADRRDLLLAQLAALAAIDVRLDPRGMATVRIGGPGGPVVVDGPRNEPVRVVASAEGGFALGVGPEGGDVVGALLGGSILGLSVARQKLLETAQRLDALADRLAGEINAAHALGVDQNGEPGGAIFSTVRLVVTAAAGNGGNARVAATLADGADPPELRLSFNAASGEWTLAHADGSSPVTGALPLTLEGVTVESLGDARGGDVYAIRPVRGARGIGTRPLAPDALAAAPRWLADRAPGNASGAEPEVRVGPPLDPPPDPPLEPPFALAVLAGGVLELRDDLGVLVASGSAGDWLAGDGFEIRVPGPLVEGDVYRIRRNHAGGGHGNVLLMLDVRDRGGSAGTLEEGVDRMVAAISVPLAETRVRVAAARENRDRAAEAMAEASGVDLNREAADMLRFQQAYQANARLIQTARETFEAILRAGAA